MNEIKDQNEWEMKCKWEKKRYYLGIIYLDGHIIMLRIELVPMALFKSLEMCWLTDE